MVKNEGILEIQTFFDGDIHPGEGIDASIKRELREADIFVALASPEYLHSTYCFVKEYKYALDRAARKAMHVAVIRPCGCKHTRMGHYKALPEDGKEVTTWGNRDSAFEDIVNGVRRMVELAEAAQRERVPPPPKNRERISGRHRGRVCPRRGAAPARNVRSGHVRVQSPASST